MTKRPSASNQDDDRRLIEDFLPIGSISNATAEENKERGGKPSDIHLWWARRPLSASRAAVYAALTPAPTSASGRGGRSRFVTELCQHGATREKLDIAEAQILEAHAARAQNNATDGSSDFSTRPRVLDPFAGGGSIPLEASRLGCDAFALDLNPVAHLVQLVSLRDARMLGPQLVSDTRKWGEVILRRVSDEIGDLYPSPTGGGTHAVAASQLAFEHPDERGAQGGGLRPVAYLWTRTVRCKDASCGGTVPLVRQAWLARDKQRLVALRAKAERDTRRVSYEVVESTVSVGLDFDPTDGSAGGNAPCLFCGTVADESYVKQEGRTGGMGRQLLAVICERVRGTGKVYLAASGAGAAGVVDDSAISARIAALALETGIEPVDEPLPEQGTLGFRVQAYGLTTWSDIFTPRQHLSLLTFAKHVRRVHQEMLQDGVEPERARAVATALAFVLDRLAHFNSSICILDSSRSSGIKSTFLRTALPMTWDFPEANPFARKSAGWAPALETVLDGLASVPTGRPATVLRASATDLPFADGFFDAVVTDPPYYDNVPYADLSDFFYVWLRRCVGDLYPEHFANPLTPKRKEAIAEPARHGGNRDAARGAYEAMIAEALREMNRVLRPGAPLVCVYAHKMVAGWTTLIDAMRRARFMVVEAWPLGTENSGRIRANESAALASSIFLVARKRTSEETGAYETQVRPALEAIVRERVQTLWDMGISGADLVIAAVGAGLRAFTRFAKVEYANGEEVPSERFLGEVEGVVLETLLEKIFGMPRSGVAAVDGPSRFYVLWRYAHRAAEMDAGEAIVFTYGQPVELDGPKGLSAGTRPLIEKKKGKYRILDFTERGDDEKLGSPGEDGSPAPLVDVLHRALWLVEHQPRRLSEFLTEARPDRERLRLCAQALAGAGLKGKSEDEAKLLVGTTAPEQAALGKLLANWRSLVEQQLGEFDTKGQKKIAFEKGGTSP